MAFVIFEILPMQQRYFKKVFTSLFYKRRNDIC